MSALLSHLKEALAGRYDLERELGQGGMSAVFLAVDHKHGRRVALKVLKPELAHAIGTERFLQEITTTAALSHPHILPLHESGEAAGLPYYVMPFVEGESLRDRLNRERQLSLEDTVGILKEVGSALSHAHERGVVHRDIKPENVLLAGGHAVVSDFGIARAVDAAGADRLTETGIAVGTPSYMSPEQASGDRLLDARSDIYSLGCIAYEMLAGQPPFTGPNAVAVMARHSLDPVPPLRTLRRTVPEGVERAIERALAKAPADRFASVAEFIEALEEAVLATATPTRAVRSRRPSVVQAGLGAIPVLALGGWLAVSALGGPGGPLIESLAVLPPDDLSGDSAQAYFVGGMHEALIDELAKIGSLRVISRRTMRRYQNTALTVPEIARELNVSGVLESSVVRDGNMVRLRVQLVRAVPEEQSLWAETYERGLEDVLLIHSDVARSVAQRVRITLTPSEVAQLDRQRQVDPQVYEAYLRGMFELSKPTLEDRHRGLAYLHEAVDRDPGNALAYAGLAFGYAAIGHDDAVIPDAWARARAAAQRAVTLDPELAEGQAALAEIKYLYERDWPGAEQAFLRALALKPSLAMSHYHYSWYLFLFDRVDEAIAAHKRAQELDPLTPVHTSDLAVLYADIGRAEEAVKEAEKARELNPEAPRVLWALGIAYAGTGRLAEAIAVHEKMVEIAPRWSAALAVTYAKAGRVEEARQILDTLERMRPTPWTAQGLASIYAALGENDAAFRWLSFEPAHAWIPWVKTSSLFKGLRDDPRFDELLQRFHLPTTSAGSRPARA